MSHLTGPDQHGVFTITFDSSASPDHRLSNKMFASLHAHLNTVESHGGPPLYDCTVYPPRLDYGKKYLAREPGVDAEHRPGKATALVITGPKQSKFFSNGFDFQYLGSDWAGAFEDLHRLCLRLIKYPVPTVACLNGHCFAGAVFVALSCDYRVMHSKKGFFCLNELGEQAKFSAFQKKRHFTMPSTWVVLCSAKHNPFTDQAVQIINGKVRNMSARTRLLLGAERISGPEAHRLGLVDFVGAEPLELAMKLAKEHAKKGENHELYRVCKERLLGREYLEIMEDWGYNGDPNVKSKL